MVAMRRVALFLLCLFLAGCNRWPPPEPSIAPLAAPPPVPLPRIVSFTGEPAVIKPGASATLRWETQGALAANLEPQFGVVELNGSRQVEPARTTVYQLTIHGAGHTAVAAVTVTVLP